MSTVKRELSVDPWKYCTSGSCKSFNKSNSFTLDCLKSPADPTTWRGASSHARFGLDIGGTLCKVVYFEPFENLVSPALPGDMSSANPLIGRAVNNNDSHFFVDSIVQGDCMSENGTGAWQGKQHGATMRDSSIGTSSYCTLRNGEYVMDNCVSHYEEEKLKDSCVNCEVVNGKLEVEANTGGHIGKAKSMSQVHKIWTSSHAPVVLPGRGTLYFKCFETWRMEEFLLLTKEHSLVTGGRALGATGGGARKFNSQFYEIAGLQLKRADELISLVRGIDFLTKHSQHETFEYPKGSFQGGVIQRPIKSPEESTSESDGSSGEDEVLLGNELEEPAVNPHSEKEKYVKETKSVRNTRVPESPCESGVLIEGNLTLYPYLVVNIGSGVSILLVESPDKFKRVGGTSLGGSTFFGLTSVLTGCSSFQEAIDLAAEGDSTEIDMLVGDIYGGDYSEMGLAATTVASSFGKLVQPSRRSAALKMPQHLAKATLLMITNNIGSLAKLHAQATGADRVLFTGSFMHGNKLAMRLLAVAMEFWSKGQIKAIFLQHEGHAGAMGALLSALDPNNPTDFLLLN